MKKATLSWLQELEKQKKKGYTRRFGVGLGLHHMFALLHHILPPHVPYLLAPCACSQIVFSSDDKVCLSVVSKYMHPCLDG